MRKIGRSLGAPRRVRLAAVAFVGAVFFATPKSAVAERVLTTVDGWKVFSDGRASGFLSWTYGDGYPQPIYGTDAAGKFITTPLSSPVGGGFRAVTEQKLAMDPNVTGGTPVYTQGSINMMRVRSGFISNTFGFGLRNALSERLTVTAYVQFWAFVENNGRQKNLPNIPDARQGFVKLEGPWGFLTAGRTRALFSRGNTDTDVFYAHRFGLGFPGNIDSIGPTQGQLGFGVLGVGFSSGVVYGSPVVGGLQLNIGVFDPVQLQGFGGWTRTKYVRPEVELTFERTFGEGAWGKVALFASGESQKVYKDSYCSPVPDPATNSNLPCEQTIAGAAYGGRLELGPVHLGVSGFYGQGLGLNYALEVSEAAQDRVGNLRKLSGVHVQTQFVIRKFDLFAGWGVAQVYLTDHDNLAKVQDPRDPANPNAQIFAYNVLKSQMGINAGVVYNMTPSLHFDLDFFRAQADWFAVNNTAGQKQVVWVGNAGATVNW